VGHDINKKSRYTDSGNKFDKLFIHGQSSLAYNRIWDSKDGLQKEARFELYTPEKHGVWNLNPTMPKGQRVRLVYNTNPSFLEIPNIEVINNDFTEKLLKSLNDSRETRLKRISKALIIPQKIVAQSVVFIRNPDIVAEVLQRAVGVCEGCSQPAPFNRISDGTPYLEVHHKIQLSKGGEDTLDNTVALCPNCHRKTHYGLPT
jgi:HNH endonuclease